MAHHKAASRRGKLDLEAVRDTSSATRHALLTKMAGRLDVTCSDVEHALQASGLEIGTDGKGYWRILTD